VLFGKLPALVIAGQKASIAQTLRITNDTAGVIGSSTTSLFLDASPTIDTNAIALPATLVKNLKLKMGKTSALRIGLKSLPATVPPGTYYLVAQVQANGATTDAVSPTTVQVEAPQVVLAGTFRQTPAAATAGKKFSAAIVVTNTGNVPAAGPLDVVISASTDGTLADAAGQVASFTKKVNIKPGKSTTLRISGLTPLTAGAYFLIAQVDPNNVFGSPDIAGNTFVSATAISVS